MIELGKPELLLFAPLLITLTLIGHFLAQKLKRSLEVFHYPPVQRLTRLAVKKGVQRSPWRTAGLALKISVVMLIVFSLANPTVLTFSEISEKMDVPVVMEKDLAGKIVLAIDTSASMGLRDVLPSRLEAAKNILVKFVQNATEEVRFGVVTFDREVRDTLPMTEDRNTVVSMIGNLTEAEGLPCLEEFTDIGIGLQTSADFLTPYALSNKTNAIILVSDGFANYGYPNPFESVSRAVQKAKDIDVSIYTLHISRMGQDSNYELMRRIAEETDGKFMETTSIEELKSVLDIIGKYYVPIHEWSSEIEIKTTIPVRTDLGLVLMLGAAILVVALWVGNYKHYKTSF